MGALGTAELGAGHDQPGSPPSCASEPPERLQGAEEDKQMGEHR